MSRFGLSGFHPSIRRISSYKCSFVLFVFFLSQAAETSRSSSSNGGSPPRVVSGSAGQVQASTSASMSGSDEKDRAASGVPMNGDEAGLEAVEEEREGERQEGFGSRRDRKILGTRYGVWEGWSRIGWGGGWLLFWWFRRPGFARRLLLTRVWRRVLSRGAGGSKGWSKVVQLDVHP